MTATGAAALLGRVAVQLLLAPAQAGRARLRPRGAAAAPAATAPGRRSARAWSGATTRSTTAHAGRLAAEALTDMLVEREVQRLRAARASRDTEPRRVAGGHRAGAVPGVADRRGGPAAARELARAAAAARRPLRCARSAGPPDARLVSWSAGWCPAARTARSRSRPSEPDRPTAAGPPAPRSVPTAVPPQKAGERSPARTSGDPRRVPGARLRPAVRRPGRQHVRRLADADRAEHVGQDADRLQRRRRAHLPVR